MPTTSIHITANACFKLSWCEGELRDENGEPLPEFIREAVVSCFPADSRVDDWDWCELVAECTAEGYHDPGVCSGPPESCYPPEGEIETVVELIRVQRFLTIGDHTRKQGDETYLSDSLNEQFREHFEDRVDKAIDAEF